MQIHQHRYNGIWTQYVEVNIEGRRARIYKLPGVPADPSFVIESEQQSNEKMLEITLSRIPEGSSLGVASRVQDIFDRYQGRQFDAGAVLCHALDSGRFDEFAERLESYRDLVRIPPYARQARSDVTAFFMQQFLDLGVGDANAQLWVDFNNAFGPGMIVFSRGELD